jgi:hypothetical protein
MDALTRPRVSWPTLANNTAAWCFLTGLAAARRDRPAAIVLSVDLPGRGFSLTQASNPCGQPQSQEGQRKIAPEMGEGK